MLRPLFLALVIVFLAGVTGCGGSTDLRSGPGGSGATGGSSGTGGVEGGGAGEAAGGTDSRGGEPGAGGSVGGSAGDGVGNAAGEAAGGTAGDPTVPLEAIEITPSVASVAVGTEALFVATAHFADGSTGDVTRSASWTSSATAVASVSNGVVAGVAAGSATITARLDGVSGSALVSVPSATVESLSVTPPTASVGIAGNVAFHAVVTLTDGSTQDVTSTAAWSSTDPTVARVSGSGTATGVSAGSVTVRATAGGASGTASLTVTSATLTAIAVTPTNPTTGVDTSLVFVATGTFSDASVADVSASATWSSSDETVATFDAATRSAHTEAAGTTLIAAKVGSVSGGTTLTVTDATLESIAVTPATTTLAVNGTVLLVATGTYSDGTSVDLTGSVAWSSADSGVASVSSAAGSAGQVRGLEAGTSVITAAFQGVSGQGSVTVTAADLVSLTLTPLDPTLPVAATLAFSVTGVYSDGSEVDLTASVSFTSSDAAVGAISNASGQEGVLTALAPGSTTVTAALDGVEASTTVTVTDATLVSIAVTPASLTLSTGASRGMTAIGYFSDDSSADLTTSAVWTSSDQASVTVSNAAGSRGLVTAIDLGTATVTATFGGVSGSTSVTVAEATLEQLVLEPIAASVPEGETVRYTATAIFSDNSSRNVTGDASWNSSDTSVASLSGGGGPGGGGPGGEQATALTAGTTTISATYRGVTGTTTLTVTSATLSEIVVTPINPTLPVGRTQQLVATAIYSDNTSQVITGQVTWESSDTDVAQVSTAGGGGPGGGGPGGGTVTALGHGTATISASWGGLTGSTSVTVTDATLALISLSPAVASLAVDGQQQFTAQAIFSDNTSVDVTQAATWLSSDATLAGISSAGGPGGGKGLATALAAGSVTLSASYGGLTGSAQLTVTSATLVAIELTPPSPSVALGTSVTFSATALYSDNTSRNVTSLATWTSSNATVAQVSTAGPGRGVAQTLASGTTAIGATYNGVAGSTQLKVTAATLTEIQLTPFEPTLLVGLATRFAATGIYDDFTTADLTSAVTWTSSDSSVVSLSNASATRGQATPLAAGSVTVSATYQGVTGTNAVSVSDATISALTVTPASASIAPHAALAFTATATLSDDSELDVTSYVTWLSSTASIASISNAAGSQGVATGLSAGSVTITAVRGSVSGTTSLTVQ